MQLSARTLALAGAVALALSNVGRLPGGAIGGRNSPFILADLVTAGMGLFVVLALVTGRVRPVIDRTVAAVAAFLLVALVSAGMAIWRYSPGIVESVGILAFLARWVAYFMWYPLVAWCLTRDEADQAWRYTERAILAFCVFGLFQSAFLPGFAQMLESAAASRTWDIQGRRLVSTVLDPNFAGIFIVIALLSRLARLAEGERENGLVLATLATGLLLTVSRSSILGFVTGLSVLALTQGLRLRIVKALLVGAVLLLPFISLLIGFAAGFNKFGIDGSAAQRLIPWTRAVLLLRDHPWLGAGFNAIAQAQQVRGWRQVGGAEATLDGGLLFVAAMTGFVGLYFYVRILARVTASARRLWRDPATPAAERAHASASVASMCAVVVHSLFVNSLLLPFVMQILWTMWGRLAHLAAARRARLASGAVLPLALLLAGCDPCATTTACASSDELALSGSIVHHADGTPIPGATVEVRFVTDGQPEVVRTVVTNSEGLWALHATMPGREPVVAHARVLPPHGDGYDVPPFEVRRGAPFEGGQWVDTPSVRFLGTLLNQGSRLGGALVWFEPTGGVPLHGGGRAGPYANHLGIFEIVVTGPQVGTVYGNLVVEHPDIPYGRTSVKGFPVQLHHRWMLRYPDVEVEPGARMVYGGWTVFRGTGQTVPGVTFRFVRTGGVPASPGSFSLTSAEYGFFMFALTPDDTGAVIGDVTLTPPTGAPAVYRDVRLATYDSLYHRAIEWRYGEAWKWRLQLQRADGAPAAGIPVRFRRTSGLAITPDSVSDTTDASGRIDLSASVLDTGTVVGDLVVAPESATPHVIRGLRLRTNPDDAYHFGGVHRIGTTTP